jgi:hypothetical protein
MCDTMTANACQPWYGVLRNGRLGACSIHVFRSGLDLPWSRGWHFVTLPDHIADDIRSLFHGTERGWGSFPVTATIGSTHWVTSIFPDKASSSFVLPLKAEVRCKEHLGEGAMVSICLELDP